MFWYSIWTREHVRTTIRPEAPKTPSSGIKIISICLTWMIAHRAWPNESCSSGCLFLDRVSSRWGGVWSGSLSDPNVVLDWRKRALTHTDDRQCSMSRRPFLKGGECVVGRVYADASSWNIHWMTSCRVYLDEIRRSKLHKLMEQEGQRRHR